MSQIFIFLTTGFEEIEALSCVDVLRRAELNIKMVSLEPELTVYSKNKIPVTADLLFSQVTLDNVSMLILPGGSTRINEHQNLKDLLLTFNQQNGKIAAICAAPMVLGEIGLLVDKKATCYPGMESYLRGAILQTTPVVIDGNIITGRGPAYAFDFALTLLEVLTDTNTKQRIAEYLLIK